MLKRWLKNIMLSRLENQGYVWVKKDMMFALDIFDDLEKSINHLSFKNIFDVGANVGIKSLQFAQKFPQAQIYAFEPITNTYQELINNTKGKNNIKCFNFALGNKQDSITVELQENSQLNSLINHADNQNDCSRKRQEVEIKTVDNLFNNKIERIDFLKTDTEGFDLEVLKGANSFLKTNRILFIYSEVGFSDNDLRHTNFCLLNNYLKEFGFHLFGIYEQTQFGRPRRKLFANALFLNPHAVRQHLESS